MQVSLLEKVLTQALGLDTDVEDAGISGMVIVRPRQMQRPHGFRVEIVHRFSWLEATVEFDSLASQLRTVLGDALAARKDEFDQAVESFQASGVKYRELPSGSGDGAPWMKFAARLSIDDDPQYDHWQLIALSVLVPIVQILQSRNNSNEHFDEAGTDFDEEGQVQYHLSRSYERSRSNRSIAIAIHGNTCKVCNINFDDFYGEDISQGYVEVHHLLPVSMMKVPTIVDPRNDLVPLCANCHRMAHRKWPPYSPAELRQAILNK